MRRGGRRAARRRGRQRGSARARARADVAGRGGRRGSSDARACDLAPSRCDPAAAGRPGPERRGRRRRRRRLPRRRRRPGSHRRRWSNSSGVSRAREAALAATERLIAASPRRFDFAVDARLWISDRIATSLTWAPRRWTSWHRRRSRTPGLRGMRRGDSRGIRRPPDRHAASSSSTCKYHYSAFRNLRTRRATARKRHRGGVPRWHPHELLRCEHRDGGVRARVALLRGRGACAAFGGCRAQGGAGAGRAIPWGRLCGAHGGRARCRMTWRETHVKMRQGWTCCAQQPASYTCMRGETRQAEPPLDPSEPRARARAIGDAMAGAAAPSYSTRPAAADMLARP